MYSAFCFVSCIVTWLCFIVDHYTLYQALGEAEIDVVYLNGWVAIFQTLFAIPLIFPSAAVISLPFQDILPNMQGGLNCWMGANTIEKDNLMNLPADECAYGPLFTNLYLIFNVVYNLLIIVILKHGSANIMWMVSKRFLCLYVLYHRLYS